MGALVALWHMDEMELSLEVGDQPGGWVTAPCQRWEWPELDTGRWQGKEEAAWRTM